MRFFTPLVAIAAAVFSVNAQTSPSASGGLELLNAGNHWGAPIPPWEANSSPGWYYGQDGSLGQEIVWLVNDIICLILEFFPDCLQCPPKNPPPPPPNNPWVQTFYNLTGATQASDYLTYGLVDTIADCETMCLQVEGCNFVNSYDDVNGKGGSTQLTCALFSSCHNSSDADNVGGQTQPSGLLDFITNSNGFCHE